MGHLQHLKEIATADVEGLLRAEEQYGSSWKQRGGVGAFMMLARKWDRLERQVQQPLVHPDAILEKVGDVIKNDPEKIVPPYDIFAHIASDNRAEGVIDDIRDLRRYLLLVEAEMMSRGVEAARTVHRDNGQ
jgi:hypothetical protein